MHIIKAHCENFDTVKLITHKTISEVYPRYYAKGVVDFFLAHHSDENIMKDILDEMVYLVINDKEAIGTVTIKENEVCRLFVLPKYQHEGAGKQLLDFAEKKIADGYVEICLAASLPAKNIYMKRGYTAVETHEIVAENGDVLCFDFMRKNSNYKNKKLNYNGRKFIPKCNTENGEVDEKTIFSYFQRENIVWAEYMGGDIQHGFLIGKVDDNGNLTYTYQHLNKKQELRVGKCCSNPIILENGKIEMHEEWQWLNGDKTKGTSVLIEV